MKQWFLVFGLIFYSASSLAVEEERNASGQPLIPVSALGNMYRAAHWCRLDVKETPETICAFIFKEAVNGSVSFDDLLIDRNPYDGRFPEGRGSDDYTPVFFDRTLSESELFFSVYNLMSPTTIDEWNAALLGIKPLLFPRTACFFGQGHIVPLPSIRAGTFPCFSLAGQLKNSEIRGDLFVTAMTHAREWPNIQSIMMEYNDIKARDLTRGLDVFAKNDVARQNLRYLDLADNDFREGFGDLCRLIGASFPQLAILHVDGKKHIDVEELLDGIAHLKSLATLEVLSITPPDHEADPSVFERLGAGLLALPALKKLYMQPPIKYFHITLYRAPIRTLEMLVAAVPLEEVVIRWGAILNTAEQERIEGLYTERGKKVVSYSDEMPPPPPPPFSVS